MIILLLVIPFVLFWSSLYYICIRKFSQTQSPEFSNRLITLCHGCFVASLGSSQCVINGWAFYNYNTPTTYTQATLLLASLGYFIFDLVWCLYYQTETHLMIAHHIYSCFAMSRMLVKGISADQATCALGLMEVTNPILQCRWFIRTLGYHDTLLFKFVELIFLIVFITMRLVLGSIIAYEVLRGNQDLEFKFLAVLIYLVSWGFMINMFCYVRKKYKRISTDEGGRSSLTYSS